MKKNLHKHNDNSVKYSTTKFYLDYFFPIVSQTFLLFTIFQQFTHHSKILIFI